ncbi:MAG: hypothetical protein MUF22_06820 [Chitinispirillaceae bacterium]|jgi:hypothetical protein|nr:hypothetical protein [Chitinispirillaceae bacterium]
MKQKIIEHFAGIALVTLAAIIGVFAMSAATQSAIIKNSTAQTEHFGTLSFVDFNNPFDLALLRDVVDIYYPGQHNRNDSMLGAVIRSKQKEFSGNVQNARVHQALTWTTLTSIAAMYARFFIVYLIVMALTWYGVETIAVWRFTYRKRHAGSTPKTPVETAKRLFAKLAGNFATVILFCPAYVIAYAIRTEFNTDTVVFLILLGVISNGVLITYANKFYSFLTTESRRGYVDTAIVKNCHNSYSRDGADGISLGALFSIGKRFPGHVFDHIFRNARFHYRSTIKEQASFIITGIIIIEMALNIHGYLSYEMLRQLLYKNYSIVAAIMLGIFYTVKLTDIATDYIMHRESLRYENISA